MIRILIGFILILIIVGSFIHKHLTQKQADILSSQVKPSYWFLLHRKSNVEHLYFGNPGEKENSRLVKMFTVKTGIPGEKPTPLPHLLNREYWRVVDKMETFDNPETAPYFLMLDIPVSDEEPFGPTPYLECNGQCDWILPGSFGLHGTGDDPTKLSDESPGSSGCVRHDDNDITFLYYLLSPKEEEIRYYVKDI